MNLRWYGPSIVLLVTVAGALVIGPSVARRVLWTRTDQRIVQVRESLASDPSLATLSDAFTQVSRVVEPSVVHVQVFGSSARTGGFFSRFDPLTPLGSGSGWVYEHLPRDGGVGGTFILTNAHVVRDAQSIRIRLADGTQADAKLMGQDKLTDVAVLKVEDTLLHAAAVSVDAVRKGQIVFAFGSPYRFDFSVSQGIVSASGRQLDVSGSGKYEDFIQTDAAINPGNSGGPLTDILGRVIGMNTAIARNPNAPGSESAVREYEGFVGLGFAIPVQMVIDVADKIIDTGQVQRGYLGVYIRELTPGLAKSFHFEGKGVLVEHALGGGPAALGGLRAGDIVTHVAGLPVHGLEDLRYRVSTFPPGEKISLTIHRQGGERPLEVKLSELPDPGEGPMPSAAPRIDLPPIRMLDDDRLLELGIELIAGFTKADAATLGADPIEGVMVLDVRPGSTAAEQNVGRGAVITALGDTPVTDVASLRAGLEKHGKAEPMRLTTQRWDAGRREYVTRFAVFEEE